jgi:hypothetical protein
MNNILLFKPKWLEIVTWARYFDYNIWNRRGTNFVRLKSSSRCPLLQNETFPSSARHLLQRNSRFHGMTHTFRKHKKSPFNVFCSSPWGQTSSIAFFTLIYTYLVRDFQTNSYRKSFHKRDTTYVYKKQIQNEFKLLSFCNERYSGCQHLKGELVIK